MREDLITSAVSFLNDTKVQSAPLAKKVSFLESKGMSKEEIEEALARANGKAPSPASTQPQNGLVLSSTPPPVPTRPSYDWRDLFIAAVLAGGVGYGVWFLAKRVFGPWFQVPTQTELEEDKQKLDEQFQAVEDSLKEIKEQTNDALSSVSEQSKKVEESLSSLDAVLKELKQGDDQRDEEFKSIKTEVEQLKELVPKMLDRNKEAESAVLSDLQNEIKSLKSLLVSRRSPGASLIDQASSASSSPVSAPTTAAAATPNTDGLSPRLAAALGGANRPGIPAWQMASSPKPDASASPKTQDAPATQTASTSS
ncbi:peroxisomal membrane anchor protein conserved region-domain-containing protein [Gongronella butleri]|nr:peroxisomal membrane anchor protein conserved region-domain-containing protein [Gongronella butleri]